jgi:hypothetical protein
VPQFQFYLCSPPFLGNTRYGQKCGFLCLFHPYMAGA